MGYREVAVEMIAPISHIPYPISSRSDYPLALLLGVVQGLGEFLPVSSSGHLVATPWLLDLPPSALNDHAYDVALHLGTTATLVGFFWRDWLTMARQAHRLDSPEGRRFWLLALASVPGAATGYLIEDIAATRLRTPVVVAATVGTMGMMLYGADHWGRRERTLADAGVSDALLLGVAQAVALVPGVSRSGAPW
jgi:undecaprenyl-diphosphatase